MKKFLLAILLCNMLLISIISFSQSNYERGYKVGYINASCFDITGNCDVSVPKSKSNKGKYRDGYTYGFEEGLKNRKDISDKKLLKDYYNLSGEIRNLNYNANREKVFIKAYEKIKQLYLIGDYERCIYLSEIISTQMDRDYISRMFIGLSLLELEEFKQGQKMLKIAAAYAQDESKQIILKTLEEVASGTFKANKIASEGGVNQINSRVEEPQNKQVVSTPKAEPVKEKNKAISTNKFLLSGKEKYEKKDYANAVADLTKAIDEKATPRAYYLRALAKEQLGDMYGAGNDFAYIVASDISDNSITYTDVYQRYGNILLKQKKYPQVITQMDSLIKLNDKTSLPLAYYTRGIAKINNSDKESGCLDLSKAGELGYKEAYDAIKKLCE